MDLILWRHAEAEDGGSILADHQRRLTQRGEKQARQLARWLQPHLPRKLTILASPTERTRQTAHALGLTYEIEPKVGAGATATAVLAAAGWPARDGAVLVVGHQPTLGRVAALLLSGQEDDWAVKKGGVWWFAGRDRGGRVETVLRAVRNPDFA
ncbi:MAG: histidine phosphatase family protein [Sterolibacteriaceae bacterium]|uniref:SixA phosphatase family protein n=1 Tax=Sulfuritalea sp. TaxID=2480090 RepID=UPI001A5F6E7B|nr:histidine phosphatase family protein [Sulfuritalea sp.]MBL8478202.1 histidine phosphatase family protein [Sterolibacteriaceae bacterium]MBN8473425.1 histidine phosphatase family protein [Sulfuritalea sp.]